MPKGLDKPALYLGAVVTGPVVEGQRRDQMRTVVRTGESATGILVSLTFLCEGRTAYDPEGGNEFVSTCRIRVAEVSSDLRRRNLYIPLTHLVVLPPDTNRNQFGVHPNGPLVPVIGEPVNIYAYVLGESQLGHWTKPGTRWLDPVENVWGIHG